MSSCSTRDCIFVLEEGASNGPVQMYGTRFILTVILRTKIFLKSLFLAVALHWGQQWACSTHFEIQLNKNKKSKAKHQTHTAVYKKHKPIIPLIYSPFKVEI